MLAPTMTRTVNGAETKVHDLEPLEFHSVRALLVERLVTPLGRTARCIAARLKRWRQRSRPR